jgi:FkbM family methyltransferase
MRSDGRSTQQGRGRNEWRGGMAARLGVKDKWVLLAASLTLPSGDPRFHLGFPAEFSADPGANCLVAHELRGGYELPTRNVLERAIRRGDLFVDVGAHWGFFTLQAATHPAGDVTVIGFEPDPANAAILFRNVIDNALADKVSVVSAACGDEFEIAPLVSNSTMMHSIRGVGLKPPFARGPSKWVPVVTLDRALTAFPQTARARIILKVDAEGFEPQVLAGAKSLLRSGRVAIIVWECGHAFADGAEREAMRAMVGSLDDLGFRHLRPPSQETDGPLAPFDVEASYVGNVISHQADVEL